MSHIAGTRYASVLTQTGSGSVGDQAMIDAASCHLIEAGYKVVIGPNIFDTRSGGRVPGGSGKLDVACNLAGMVLRSRSIGFVGADVLDGVYNPTRILRRIRFLHLAHRLGCDVRVFGCSWSLTPSAQVAEALRAAPWLKLHARDRISRQRMETEIGRDIPLVADLAFLLRPEIRNSQAQAAADWIDGCRAGSMTVMGLNLSGHTLESAADHGVGAFAGLVGRWLDADPDRAVLIIPHDRRGGLTGDMQVLRALHAALADRYGDRLRLLPETLDAWDIKALAGKLDFVLTGRMHLAIAAMGMGVPALCTVYQGKFEGLMDHFGLEGMTMTPAEVLAQRCDDQLARVTAQAGQIAAQIRDRLPGVQDLSRRNFEGM